MENRYRLHNCNRHKVFVRVKGDVEMDNENLALEMLKELKSNARRWFTIAIVELIIILGITGMFIWYVNQPVDEEITYTQDADTEGDYSTIKQSIGE